MMAQGEWYMTNKSIPHEEYSKMPAGFYPVNFDADAWVKAIKDAGAKYICFTTRHHDGLSMFDSKYSDYNIVKQSPFGRDVVKELAEACQKHGIKLHLYYSHIDWGRDDAPQGRTGVGTRAEDRKIDWPHYYQFMNNQLTELLTNYGPIGAIWFDGHWDLPNFDWQYEEQYALIHSIQPGCLIGNNHHTDPFDGEDIQIFERDQPGDNTAGLSGQAISPLPLETCQTMNGMWGYKIEDQNYKPTRELIHYLVETAGKNANLLLNIGPESNGNLPAAALQRLKEMGEWMKVYGETIYGTRGGDVAPHDWGVTTRKGNRLFVHILNLPDNGLYIPLQAKVKKAIKFDDKTDIEFKQDKDGVLIKLPYVPTEPDFVVELELK